MTLADLPAAYAAARSATAATAVPRGPGLCPHCDDDRMVSESTGAHARCLVPLAFQCEVYELWRSDAGMTLVRIATACGVKINTIQRWIRGAAQMRRAA